MNDIYPNVTFDFVTVASADDYMQKLQAALTSGSDVPDILAMEINNVGKFYDMGIAEDLEQHEIDKDLLPIPPRLEVSIIAEIWQKNISEQTIRMRSVRWSATGIPL